MARSCDAGNRSWAPVERAGPAPSAPSCAMPVSLCVSQHSPCKGAVMASGQAAQNQALHSLEISLKHIFGSAGRDV